ncbi:hypothetical protein COU37_03200 [Candidatus Micrarchaeota archaeon CG10_big_fil_rev_8_21_14_0_10_45_29]|nr:MAG: hypothetical protein COU37_03200 [Candidatus Micrarchaeota archaeon CG10_big_fil_rev_8_21_14_0_10_45_29]QBM01585.1 hypothetical protein [uncultured archaeon]
MFLFQQGAFKEPAKQAEVTQEQYNSYTAKITEAATQFNNAHTILKNAGGVLESINNSDLEKMAAGFAAALKGFGEAQSMPGLAAAPASHPPWLETNEKNSLNYLLQIMPEQGKRALKAKNYEKAIEAFEHLIKLGDNSALTAYNLAQAYDYLGLTLKDEGKTKEAKDAFKAAVGHYEKANKNKMDLPEEQRYKVENDMDFCKGRI